MGLGAVIKDILVPAATTVIAVLSWQLRAAQIEQLAERRRSEQVAATQVFEELSRLMEKRLYRMRWVHNALNRRQPRSELDRRWARYLDVLFEWNENLNRNLALTQRYFGDSARAVLEFHVSVQFRELGRFIEAPRRASEGLSPYDTRQALADRLNNVIYLLDVSMIQDIQTGNVGPFRTTQ